MNRNEQDRCTNGGGYSRNAVGSNYREGAMHQRLFEPNAPCGKKGGVNRGTVTEAVSECLCAETTPTLLSEITSQRAKWPDKGILLATADVNNAYRNFRVAANHPHEFCSTLGDIVVADFRLTFGRVGSPGYWGFMAPAVQHSHCNTKVGNAKLLPEGIEMMSHAKIVEPWEVGPPTRVPREADVKPNAGGGLQDVFFCGVYVDAFILL